MKCELLKTPAVRPSRKSGFDSVMRATANWQRRHIDDNARIAEGVILATGTIKPRLDLFVAISAKAKAWHEHWDAQLAEHALAAT